MDHWEGNLSGSISKSNTLVINSDLNIKVIFKEGTQYKSNDSLLLSNNSARLTTDGFTLGSGTASISELRKEVPVTLSTPNSNFEIGTANGSAYAIRSYVNSESIYLIVPIKNISNSDFGFVKAAEIKYKDSNGDVLYTENLANFINGSAGEFSSSNTVTDSCLFAGEKGYLLSIALDSDADSLIYSELAKIEIDSITGDYDTNLAKPNPEIVPQSLSYKEGGYHNQLTIGVKNKGTATGYIAYKFDGEYHSHAHTYILLDNNDVPAEWGFISQDIQSKDGVINAGETGLISENYFDYDGTANQIIVFTDYENESSNSTTSSVTANSLFSTGIPLSPKQEQDILKFRNKQEKEKQQNLQSK